MKADISKLERKLAQANASVKPLKIEVEKGRLRIRVRRKDINFTKYTFDYSDSGINATVSICQEILVDYYRGNFDSTLVKYGLVKPDTPKLTEIISLPTGDNSEPNLLEIWEDYKALKSNETSAISKENKWRIIDNCLSQCSSNCLLLSNADKLLESLRTKYADTTIKMCFDLLSSAVNLAIKLGKIKRVNPFVPLVSLLKLPKKKIIKSYSKAEIKIIIDAFKSCRFDSDKSAYPSSFYAPIIEFRFLTGCRPSEAIALTWDDIKDNGDKMQIVFNKRISARNKKNKIPEHGTKNGIEARIFPCNKQLTEFIRSLPTIPNENNLVFPSYNGDIFHIDNFSKRIWKKYVETLVELGEVKEYLPFYDQRHTFITHVVRNGIDLATTAGVSGNNPKTIINNYLATNNDIELPEI
ncbi:tyrosine-type recombinase/integrase [Sphaerospermopsis sp. LEGE 08334]|uniref:tyrosine-type recombinase/integrase n=1 Tax=Sphaerospermopsis sp. LEGE 08334 TaxID=1828651 RepID=UPI0018801BC7|nr:tyrosine-type recombinase/integrase [Sphaerospermopsis sp. LEGE 08334]MBE9056416.1 tyrosine-type recombinase/integrase [Sphaerospermopsis sp. LEGE 08334]